MKLTISKQNLTKLLARVVPATSSKSLPILGCVLLKSDDEDSLQAVGTDLTVSVTAKSPAKSAGLAALAVNASDLYAIAKSLPNVDVTLTEVKNGVEIRAGKARFKLPALDAEEYPQIPVPADGVALEIDSKDLASLISIGGYAQSYDDTRPHLSCMLLGLVGSQAVAVSTDGHRLAMAKAPAQCSGKWEPELVHAKATADVRKLCEDLGEPVRIVRGTQGFTHYCWPSVTLSVKQVSETFPPYEKVIPKGHPKHAELSKAALADAIKRVSVVQEKSNNKGLRLELTDGSLSLFAQTDRGECTEQLDAVYAGEPLTIGVSANYLLEAVQAIPDDDVCLELKGDLDAILVRGAKNPDECSGTVMPQRI